LQKRIVITGMTSGVGQALTEYFLNRNEHVIGISRDQSKLDAVKASMQNLGGTLDVYQADFKNLKDVDDVISAIQRDYPEGIDVLINNAALVPKKKQMTVDGFETQFQVNHLVPVKFSHGFFELLKSRQGKIITTSSNAHLKAKFEPNDLQGLKKYHALRSYARTKLYNVMTTLVINDYYAMKHGMKAYAVHPGLVQTDIGTKDTSKLYAWLWRKYTKRGITAKEAVFTYAFLVYEDDPKTTIPYFYNSQPYPYSEAARDKDNLFTVFKDAQNKLGVDFDAFND